MPQFSPGAVATVADVIISSGQVASQLHFRRFNEWCIGAVNEGVGKATIASSISRLNWAAHKKAYLERDGLSLSNLRIVTPSIIHLNVMRKFQILVFCTTLTPLVNCQAQEFPETGLSQEQMANLFVDGKVVSGFRYDVIGDTTTNSSVQRLGPKAYVSVSFSSPKKSTIKPTFVDVSIGEIHSNFEWNYAQDITVRCDDTTFTVPGSTSGKGGAAYKCELSANGEWAETYHVKISLAQLREICLSESPYLRVGRNTEHTFDLNALGKGAFITVEQVITDLSEDESEQNQGQMKLTVPEYSVMELRDSPDILAPKYVGQDAFKIAEGFVKMAQSKSEFETTADFNQRRSALLTNPLVGSLTASNDLAIQLDDNAYSTLFDADKQVLNVTLNFDFYLPSPEVGRASLKLRSRITPLGSYVGANSFGVEKEVQKYNQTYVELKFSDFKNFKIKLDRTMGADNV